MHLLLNEQFPSKIICPANSCGFEFPPGFTLFQLFLQIFDLSLLQLVLLLCSFVLLHGLQPFRLIFSYKLLKLHSPLFILSLRSGGGGWRWCWISYSTLTEGHLLWITSGCEDSKLTCCCSPFSSNFLRATISMRLLKSCRLRPSSLSTSSNSACFFRISVFCRVFTPVSRSLPGGLNIWKHYELHYQPNKCSTLGKSQLNAC